MALAAPLPSSFLTRTAKSFGFLFSAEPHLPFFIAHRRRQGCAHHLDAKSTQNPTSPTKGHFWMSPTSKENILPNWVVTHAIVNRQITTPCQAVSADRQEEPL